MIKHSIRRRARGVGRAGRGFVIASGVGIALAACGTASPAGQQPAGHGSGSGASSQPTGTAGPGRAVTPSPSSSQSSSSPGGAGALAGFRVLSISFVSDLRGWALGTVRCGTGRCVALLSTPDGGRSWQPLTAPTRAAGAVYSTCPAGPPCVQQIRFATSQLGYAYDPSLLITTDGGEHWQKLGGPYVSSLEAADGTVVRVASDGMGCSGMRYQVDSAPVGTTAWHTLPGPAIEMICPPVLYRQGHRVVLVDYGNPAGGVRASAQIARSADGGRTWTSGPDSCGGKDGYASGVALAPPDVLVLVCQHQMSGPSGVFGPAWDRVSVDGGATFGPDHVVPTRLSATAGVVVRYQLAAASTGRLLVVETGQRSSSVLLTETGGRTWSVPLALPAASSVLLVGYQDPLTARLAQAGTVWTTTDGGHTWQADQFSAGS